MFTTSMKKPVKNIADMKKRGIFAFGVLIQYFYVRALHTGTKKQEAQTGESPAVISMPGIGLVRSDASLFILPNSSNMRTNYDECASAQSKSILAYKILSKVTSRALALLNPISYGS
jgi:hypothetical protein